MRNHIVDPAGVFGDCEVEIPVSVDECLPETYRFVIILGAEGRVLEVVTRNRIVGQFAGSLAGNATNPVNGGCGL
jgi:hypothetical protein